MSDIYQLKRHDTWPPLRATLLQADGRPINLTGATATLRAASLSVTPVKLLSYQMTIVDAVAGVVDVSLSPDDTAMVAIYRAEIEVVFADGGRVTVPNAKYFTISIVRDLG